MRSQAPKPGQVAAVGKAAAAPEVIDPYDLMSEVNILGKIKDEWFTGLVRNSTRGRVHVVYKVYQASPKWQERAEQVDKLIEIANVPRLEQGDYNEVAKSLKKVILSFVCLCIVL